MQTDRTIWLYAANCASLDLAQALPLLTKDRVAHITRLRDDDSKRRSAAAGLLLRYAAKQLLGCFPRTIGRGQANKPYLPEHPEFCFSLSHSGDWAICAAGFTPVGADIQHIQPISDALKARFFSAEEQALCSDDKAAIRLFCAREAHGKLTGIGISKEPPHLVGSQLQISGLPIFEPAIAEGYLVCICTDANAAPIVFLPTYEQLLCK